MKNKLKKTFSVVNIYMNNSDILKILKLLKKDKKKNKKNKKIKKNIKIPKAYDNIANLTPKIISQTQYQPGFSIPKFIDYNKIEADQFSQYKKTRGLTAGENRGMAPSELELYKEFDKVKKISPQEATNLLLNKNIEGLALEKQKYLDKLTVAEERRIQKEQYALEQQELKTKKKIEGIRNPTKKPNKIIQPETFSRSDSVGLETAVGGTSDEFIVSQSVLENAEGPSLISIGSAPQRKTITIKKTKFSL